MLGLLDASMGWVPDAQHRAFFAWKHQRERLRALARLGGGRRRPDRRVPHVPALGVRPGRAGHAGGAGGRHRHAPRPPGPGRVHRADPARPRRPRRRRGRVRVQHPQRPQPPRLPQDGLGGRRPAAGARPAAVARPRWSAWRGPAPPPASGRCRRPPGSRPPRRSPTPGRSARCSARLPEVDGVRTHRTPAYLALALRVRAAGVPGDDGTGRHRRGTRRLPVRRRGAAREATVCEELVPGGDERSPPDTAAAGCGSPAPTTSSASAGPAPRRLRPPARARGRRWSSGAVCRRTHAAGRPVAPRAGRRRAAVTTAGAIAGTCGRWARVSMTSSCTTSPGRGRGGSPGARCWSSAGPGAPPWSGVLPAAQRAPRRRGGRPHQAGPRRAHRPRGARLDGPPARGAPGRGHRRPARGPLERPGDVGRPGPRPGRHGHRHPAGAARRRRPGGRGAHRAGGRPRVRPRLDPPAALDRQRGGGRHAADAARRRVRLHTVQFDDVDENRFEGGHSDAPLADDVGLWVVGHGVLDAAGTPRRRGPTPPAPSSAAPARSPSSTRPAGRSATRSSSRPRSRPTPATTGPTTTAGR